LESTLISALLGWMISRGAFFILTCVACFASILHGIGLALIAVQKINADIFSFQTILRL
jgi:hypothetical protein